MSNPEDVFTKLGADRKVYIHTDRLRLVMGTNVLHSRQMFAKCKYMSLTKVYL